MARVIYEPNIKSSAIITRDLGFKPPGLRWNGKAAITTRQLQQRKQQHHQHKRNASTQESQTQTSNVVAEASHSGSNV